MPSIAGPLRDIRSDIGRDRVAAAQALGQSGDPAALEPLLAALHDTLPAVRTAAAEALGSLGLPGAVEPLLAVLDPEPPPAGAPVPYLGGQATVRPAAARALGRLGDRRVVDVLLFALGDPDEAMRRAALLALRDLGEGELAAAAHRALAGRPEALARLGDLRAVAPLCRMLDTGGLSPEAAAAAARALGMLRDSAAVPTLLDLLRRSHGLPRSEAVQALASIGAPAVEPLLDLLHDASPVDQAGAAQILGMIGDPRAAGRLIGLLEDEQLPSFVRAATAQALGRLGNKDALVALASRLQDESQAVAQAAAGALAELQDSRAVEPLLRVAREGPDNLHRTAAAGALGRLGATAGAAAEPLEAMAEEELGLLRRAYQDAARAIRVALRDAPTELESASAPAGRGTELESAPPPAGRGTELEAA